MFWMLPLSLMEIVAYGCHQENQLWVELSVLLLPRWLYGAAFYFDHKSYEKIKGTDVNTHWICHIYLFVEAA